MIAGTSWQVFLLNGKLRVHIEEEELEANTKTLRYDVYETANLSIRHAILGVRKL